MRPARLRSVIAAAVAVALVPALAFAATGDSSPSVKLRKNGAGPAILAGGEIRGMILAGPSDNPMTALPELPRMKALGVNTVTVYIHTHMSSPYANEVKFSNASPSDNELKTISKAAHKEGMAVQFMPIIEVTDRYIWRGAITPSNPSAWWASYNTMIVHYVNLANAIGVEILSIGSELSTMQKYTTQWQYLARWVQKYYRGITTYMSTAGSAPTIPWWGEVDYIGISPYYSLSSAQVPSVNELVTVWKKYVFPGLAAMSSKFRRHILFDEIGYASVQQTAYHPAVGDRAKSPANQNAQANAYEALLLAARGQSWLRGVVWWHWGLNATPRNYIIRDKKAECVLVRYWTKPVNGRLAKVPGACVLV